MITDKLLRVSNKQAITATANSSDVIDLQNARDIGEGKELFMNFCINQTFAGGTSLQAQVVTSDSATLSNPKVIGSTGEIAVAKLVAGANFPIAINPMVGDTGAQYIGVIYTVTGTMTAGQVTADVVETIQDGKKFYKSGFQVL